MEKMSFFERLTGTIRVVDHNTPVAQHQPTQKTPEHELPTEPEEAQLTVDMWQNSGDIVIQAIVAGVKPEELEVSISHDMVTLRGKRERAREVSGSDYFYQELYWGVFSRSILLPQEIDPDEAEATIKNGLLTIKLSKLDKTKIQKLKVKNE